MAALFSGEALAELYIYQEADGTRWITDRPMEDQGMVLLRRMGYQQVARTCDGLSQQELHNRSSGYELAISTAARTTGIDKALIKAVIHVESCFNPKAVSRAGAAGLMQLMPATAERFGVKDRFDPAQNIRGGVEYLKLLQGLFRNDKRFVLAAYNAGEGAVKKYNDIPPYPETQNYVKRVLRFYEKYRYRNTIERRKEQEKFVEHLKTDRRHYD
jgi:soluble lytic murein transglycosylase-like protein